MRTIEYYISKIAELSLIKEEDVVIEVKFSDFEPNGQITFHQKGLEHGRSSWVKLTKNMSVKKEAPRYC